MSKRTSPTGPSRYVIGGTTVYCHSEQIDEAACRKAVDLLKSRYQGQALDPVWILPTNGACSCQSGAILYEVRIRGGVTTPVRICNRCHTVSS